MEKTEDADAVVSREAVASVFMERNTLAAAFAVLALRSEWAVGVCLHVVDPEWATLVIELPDIGCVSWHVPLDDVPAEVPRWEGDIEDLMTAEKYERLSEYAGT
jgi:hypothetical protein